MALRTDYKDSLLDVSVNTKKKYTMTYDSDETTFSLNDVSVYSEEGDTFGANDINTTNRKINEIEEKLTKNESKIIHLPNGKKVQWGTVSNLTIPATGQLKVEVNYPETFNETPFVSCIELGNYNIKANPESNGTTSKVTINVRSLDGAQRTSRSINWIAIG